MESWSNAAEFEAVALKAVSKGLISTDSGTTSFTGVDVITSSSVPPGKLYMDVMNRRLFVGADTASQIRFDPGPSKAEKQEQHMSRNAKQYEVTLTDGSVQEIAAQGVNETDGRVNFTGFVEGVDESYGNTVIKSFRSEKVDEYRVVPKPEVDAKAVGKNTYRVNLTDSKTKDVKADHVLFQAGTGDKPGRYSLVTSVRGGESRTEYIVGEDKVDSVERLSDDGESTTVVDNTADAPTA